MSGIIIPSDRCNHQMPRGYCLNPDCRESSTDSRYEFDVEDDKFSCPKCGSDSPVMVGLLVLIHFMIRDQKKGFVIGLVAILDAPIWQRKRIWKRPAAISEPSTVRAACRRLMTKILRTLKGGNSFHAHKGPNSWQRLLPAI
jgi:hypothetical protein